MSARPIQTLSALLTMCTLLALCPDARGQYAGEEAALPTDGVDLQLERKEPTIFHRPARETPAEQLALAKERLEKGRRRQAARALLALVHTWHDTPEAAQGQLLYARMLLDQGRHMDAFRELQYLVEYFPGYVPYNEILNDQFRIANYVSEERHGRFLFFPGRVSPRRALPLYEQIVRNAPNWEKTPEAQFRIGFIYEQEEKYVLAIDAYESVQIHYPGSEWVPTSAYRRAYCLYLVANKSPRDEERSRKAIGALIAFLRFYPEHENAAQATEYLNALKLRLAQMYFDKAEFYDKIAKRPEAAVIAYGDFVAKFPKSEMRAKAESRLKALRQQQEVADE